jgi:hypothetical protein
MKEKQNLGENCSTEQDEYQRKDQEHKELGKSKTKLKTRLKRNLSQISQLNGDNEVNSQSDKENEYNDIE